MDLKKWSSSSMIQKKEKKKHTYAKNKLPCSLSFNNFLTFLLIFRTNASSASFISTDRVKNRKLIFTKTLRSTLEQKCGSQKFYLSIIWKEIFRWNAWLYTYYSRSEKVWCNLKFYFLFIINFYIPDVIKFLSSLTINFLSV